jgi:hypothetical protein
MEKCSSPAAIRGRKNERCSGVPKRMIVGPTVLRVRNGTGAPATAASSAKTSWSAAERSCPPNSSGQPSTSQPSAPIWRTTSR